jgi:maltose O-acetyltransferase
VRIGDSVLFGPSVHLYAATHPTDPRQRRAFLERAEPITIDDGAWIGGGSIVLPGITIGKNSTIGAGSVVTRDIPANVVAAGNPCRVIRSLA